MISYDSLRDKMKEKGISQYALIRRWHINPAQITRLKRNESVSPHTIEMLSLIHISEPTRRTPISYAVFCLKKRFF